MNSPFREVSVADTERSGPVDLLRVYKTPDGIGRTLTMGTFPTAAMAAAAARETYHVYFWKMADTTGRQDSMCGGYRIKRVQS